MARPLRQLIDDIHHPHAVKDMTARPERCRYLWPRVKIEERGKGQPHISPFIGNRRTAQCTGYLARQYSFAAIEDAVVEPQVSDPGNEPDILFMEDCGPLHGCAVQGLTVAAVAYLGIDRIGADFVPYCTTMAVRPILRCEAFVIG